MLVMPFFFARLGSRHFVPGYYRAVPPRQKPFAHRGIEAPHNDLSAYGGDPRGNPRGLNVFSEVFDLKPSYCHPKSEGSDHEQ